MPQEEQNEEVVEYQRIQTMDITKGIPVKQLSATRTKVRTSIQNEEEQMEYQRNERTTAVTANYDSEDQYERDHAKASTSTYTTETKFDVNALQSLLIDVPEQKKYDNELIPLRH